MRHTTLVATLAILLGSTSVQAATGHACTFQGGKPGEANAEGNVGPFQTNGNEYKAEGETIRAAAKDARLACTAGEPLGAQGCLFNGCVDLAAADTTTTAPKN
ncbi:hypothetical protein ATO6_06800 [Oceanicola sp. 22II-s10i]|uniref:hypothetical protein n=1 Tax=Oceanicola sp. 22II-s10i TaxID=1317116 RepID=UPI000B52876B|nr:hypothetical protein [Oceanicola sp. 22II-s10i]OWU86504.1 hypothetical protein ATO6_06800 [Oceanicola sp. 22II-s10i]